MRTKHLQIKIICKAVKNTFKARNAGNKEETDVEMFDDMNLTDEEKEIVLYGLKRFSMFFASLLVTLVIGILTGETVELFIFLLLFVPLRIFAGGLHLPSLKLCAVTSTMLIVAIAVFMKYACENFAGSAIYMATAVFSALIVMILAPVDTVTKHLYRHEKKRYKIISIALTLIELGCLMCSYVVWKVRVLAYISVFAESIYLILQSMINRYKRKTIDLKKAEVN